MESSCARHYLVSHWVSPSISRLLAEYWLLRVLRVVRVRSSACLRARNTEPPRRAILIALHNVIQSFRSRDGRVRVLDQINVAFAPRARIAILGQPGSGKTTLLRVMCGAITPDSGWVSGNRSTSFPIGTSTRLYKTTIRRHIRFVANLYGRDVETFSKFVVDFANLDDVLDAPIQVVDGNARNRLNFALGIAIPFEYYLFDGAMASGDPTFRAKALRALEARRGTAGFILATRFPRLTRGYFDNGAVLHNGKLHLFGNIESAISYFESLPPAQNIHARLGDERYVEQND